MELESKEKPRNLWKQVDVHKYQKQVTISSIELEELDERVIYMEDLEKRKEAYGICGECGEPGTGSKWCKPCNAKRFKKNFKNWTSGNENVDEFIRHAQLNALSSLNCLEWIPFENFQNVIYIAKGGFGKIYSAEWPKGRIRCWDIENQEWKRQKNYKVALKSLNNSSDISADFLNEVNSHFQIYAGNVTPCFGMTQNPETKDYMMVLHYCEHGDLRNYLNKSIGYITKIKNLREFAKGLLAIHNAGKVHKDLHSGNILFTINYNYNSSFPVISDLGRCQPADNNEKMKGIYGVLPYIAPEVLHGSQYTKSSDIYSFGIVMNEFMSEEMPYSDIPHDHALTVRICNGLRPNISEYTPKLLADLIRKCWDAKPENRPTVTELIQKFIRWRKEIRDENSVLYSQVKECEKIRKDKFKNKLNEDKYKYIQTHPQAIYTSRLLNFKDLPEPVNSLELTN